MSPDNPGSSPADRVGGEQAADTPFTPEEQKEFDTMREATSGPPPAEPQKAEGEKPEKPAGSQPEKPGAEKPSKTGDESAAGEKKPAKEAGSQDDEADDDDEAEAAAKPGAEQQPKRVSYNKFRRTEDALKAEKKTRAERDTELAKLREVTARADERLKIINEAFTTPAVDPAQAAAQEDPEPDMEKDLFGYVAWQKRQIDKANKSIAEMRQGQQVSTEDQRVGKAYFADAQTFAAQEPAFLAAYNHLMNTRVVELAELHFGKDLTDPEVRLTPQEIEKIRGTFAQEEKLLVQEAFANGASPAARIWRLAKQRGFIKPQAPAQNGQGKPTNGAAAPGNLADAAAEADKKPNVAEEIANIQKGKEGSRSLSDGGGAPASPLTAEKLANMSQAEFDRMVETLPKDKMRELMGG